MFSVTRFSPLDDAFDNLLRGFVLRPANGNGAAAAAASAAPEAAARFRVDISEDDKAYTVNADLPGVKKEDIHISIDGTQVSITAESRAEKEEKDGNRVLRNERYTGKYYRGFTLAGEVDESAAVARYNDGVLQVTLPKKAPVAAKRLTIQ